MTQSRKRSQMSREQLLAAKPLRSLDARVETIGEGVRISIPAPNYWFFRMPKASRKTYELDQIGQFVWDKCDGRTSVESIIESLAMQYRLNLREAEVATLKFLQILSIKRLIGVMDDQG